MTMGRPAIGPGLVDHLEGSEHARTRLRVVLENIAQMKSVAEASAELGMGEAAFYELRRHLLEASLERAEPRPSGRPAAVQDPVLQAAQDRIGELEGQVKELRLHLEAAMIREEITATMPHLMERRAKARAQARVALAQTGEPTSEKKTEDTDGGVGEAVTTSSATTCSGSEGAAKTPAPPGAEATGEQGKGIPSGTATAINAHEEALVPPTPPAAVTRHLSQGIIRRLALTARFLVAAARLRSTPARAWRRGHRTSDHQLPRRRLEHRARRRSLAFRRYARRVHALSDQTIADLLCINARTLRSWHEDRTQRLTQDGNTASPAPGSPDVPVVGRPLEAADLATRNSVIAAIAATGPGTSVADLQGLFPQLARRELDNILVRYRHVYLSKTARHVLRLRWMKVGAVWTMDFTKNPGPVDGCFPVTFVVRDLASGYMLASLPAYDMTAATVVPVLQRLFAEHGPPLALKSDNGLDSDAVDQLLADNHVAYLVNPPHYPRYNGAVEAGIGSLKVYAHHSAVAHDRPTQWSCDDIEYGRLAINHVGQPRARTFAAADDLWTRRTPITQNQRAAFLAEVARYRDQGVEQLPADPQMRAAYLSDRSIRRDLDRVAITRALVSQGLLEFRRGRLTLPKARQKAADVS